MHWHSLLSDACISMAWPARWTEYLKSSSANLSERLSGKLNDWCADLLMDLVIHWSLNGNLWTDQLMDWSIGNQSTWCLDTCIAGNKGEKTNIEIQISLFIPHAVIALSFYQICKCINNLTRFWPIYQPIPSFCGISFCTPWLKDTGLSTCQT